jgi:transcriptional regulator with XRE-family HTH domain
MRRKPTSFDEFMREVEAETRAAGPGAQAQAEAIRDHFRLAAQVVRLRKVLQLTQQQLAVRMGVHQSEISDIERGAASPGYRMLVKLADSLNADLALIPCAEGPRRATRKRTDGRRSVGVAGCAPSSRASARANSRPRRNIPSSSSHT